MEVSLAMNVILYWPSNAGIVKLLLNLASPRELFNVNCCTVELGNVTLARTVSITPLSVTFAAISIMSETLNVLLAIGIKSKTNGTI